jgi:hypothetical protein
VETEVIETGVPEEESSNGQQPAARPQKERKYRAPKFLDDLDLDSEPSLKAFVDEHNPQSDSAKYVVIAAWFKRHRTTDAVGADHVFTGYRKMRWNDPPRDVLQPFRDLKRENLFKSVKTGLYEITQLGIDELERIKNKAGV